MKPHLTAVTLAAALLAAFVSSAPAKAGAQPPQRSAAEVAAAVDALGNLYAPSGQATGAVLEISTTAGAKMPDAQQIFPESC